MNKCVFLDRDGVLNKDKVDYVYRLEDLFILDGVLEALQKLKKAGYLLVVITNQSGIAKGLYTKEDVFICMNELQKLSGNAIDGLYYCPYHESTTDSLARKPGTLMFQKAIQKFNIDIGKSWMVGDRDRDLIPAQKLKIKTILITGNYQDAYADYKVQNLLEAAEYILQNS